ncbi:unnamed protein product [Sphacelaria rigidula]
MLDERSAIEIPGYEQYTAKRPFLANSELPLGTNHEVTTAHFLEHKRVPPNSQHGEIPCKYTTFDLHCQIAYYEYLESHYCPLCNIKRQDIEWVRIAFYKGRERQRSFAVTVTGTVDQETTHTSSGGTNTLGFYTIQTTGTDELCIRSTGLEEDEWFSLLEVEFVVPEVEE